MREEDFGVELERVFVKVEREIEMEWWGEKRQILERMWVCYLIHSSATSPSPDNQLDDKEENQIDGLDQKFSCGYDDVTHVVVRWMDG